MHVAPTTQARCGKAWSCGAFAGVYADLDFECLRPLDELLAGHTAVVARMDDGDWDQA